MIARTIQKMIAGTKTMAETRETETFALGLIVAAILYLLLRREFTKRGVSASGTRSGGTTMAAKANAGGCGCGASSSSGTSQIPGVPNYSAPISLGNQSYNDNSYSGSSVKTAPITEWGAGGGSAYGEEAG